MTDVAKRDLIAQWAFDTRPVLLRFHLWLEDVDVERAQAEPVSAHTFTPRGIARCLAMTSAATALGTRLFGDYGAGAGQDKVTVNQVKKAADAVSAYVMSEGLWHLTRTLPENHALMVCLGEGLMPKAGETPEMGANPMLGFGRVYARPELARTSSIAGCAACSTSPGHSFEQFYEWLQRARHHAVGRRRRHPGEHVTIRRWSAHGTDGGAPPLRFAAAAGPARTSPTWAASPCPRG